MAASARLACDRPGPALMQAGRGCLPHDHVVRAYHGTFGDCLSRPET